MKIFKKVIFFILFIVFLLSAIGYFVPFSNPKLNQLLTTHLKQKFNKDVFIGKVTIYPLRKAEIRNFVIKDKEMFVSAERIDLKCYPFIHQNKPILRCNLKINKIVHSQNFLSDILAIDIGSLEFRQLISNFFISKEGIHIKDLIADGNKLDISLYGKISKRGELDCAIKIYLNKSTADNIHPMLSVFLLKDESLNSSEQKNNKAFSFKLRGYYRNLSISF